MAAVVVEEVAVEATVLAVEEMIASALAETASIASTETVETLTSDLLMESLMETFGIDAYTDMASTAVATGVVTSGMIAQIGVGAGVTLTAIIEAIVAATSMHISSVLEESVIQLMKELNMPGFSKIVEMKEVVDQMKRGKNPLTRNAIPVKF